MPPIMKTYRLAHFPPINLLYATIISTCQLHYNAQLLIEISFKLSPYWEIFITESIDW